MRSDISQFSMASGDGKTTTVTVHTSAYQTYLEEIGMLLMFCNTILSMSQLFSLNDAHLLHAAAWPRPQGGGARICTQRC